MKYSSKVDIVYRAILSGIKKGEYLPGDRIVISRVARDNFELVSNGVDHAAAYRLRDNQLVRELAKGLDLEKPDLLLSRPTVLVRGFLTNTFSQRKSDSAAKKLSLALLGTVVAVMARRNLNPHVRMLLKQDMDFLDHIQVEMATARQFLFIGRCKGMKPGQVFDTANRIEKVISEQGFEVRRMKKEDIKRFLALYFDASMNGEQMPDVDGEQFYEVEDDEEEN